MKQPKTTSRLIKAAQRRSFVLDLRKAGATYTVIVERVHADFPPEDLPKNYDTRQAWQDVMRELKRLNEERRESAAEISRLQEERLTALLFAFWDRAMEGDEKAADRAFRAIKQLSALLCISPAKVVHNLNLDLSQLTDGQLERISSGENPASVLAAPTPSSSNAGTEATSANEAKS